MLVLGYLLSIGFILNLINNLTITKVLIRGKRLFVSPLRPSVTSPKSEKEILNNYKKSKYRIWGRTGGGKKESKQKIYSPSNS